MKVFKAANSKKGVLVEKLRADNGHSLGIFLMIFLASLCYTLSANLGNNLLRIAYSVLMYSSLLAMLIVYLSIENRQKLKHDKKYSYYFLLLLLFAVFNSIRDFSNPHFSLVTLINNSRALPCLIPVLGLIIGYNTKSLKAIEKAVYGLVITFCAYVGYVVVNEPSAPKIFTVCILPFAVLNLTKGRFKILTLLLFAVAAWHSVLVDYRALLLRLIFFTAFFYQPEPLQQKQFHEVCYGGSGICRRLPLPYRYLGCPGILCIRNKCNAGPEFGYKDLPVYRGI